MGRRERKPDISPLHVIDLYFTYKPDARVLFSDLGAKKSALRKGGRGSKRRQNDDNTRFLQVMISSSMLSNVRHFDSFN